MKALKITLTHGRIWTVETSSGVRAQASTLDGALDHLIPLKSPALATSRDYDSLRTIIDAIPNSGGDGQIGRGTKSA